MATTAMGPMPMGAPPGGKMPQGGTAMQPAPGGGSPMSPFSLSAMGGLPGAPGKPMPPAMGGGVNPTRAVPGQPNQMYWSGPQGRVTGGPAMTGGALGGGSYERGNPDPGFAGGVTAAPPSFGPGISIGAPGVPANDFMQRFSPGQIAAREGAAGNKMGGSVTAPGLQAPVMNAGPMRAPSAPIQTPQQPDPFSQPTSAMDVYRSSVPVMRDALQTNVGSAMADAGFSGNRFGSYAMDRAAQEGSRAGLQQNQLLTDLLYRHTNADQDRALQAAELGSQHGQAAERMQLDRMRLLGDLGMFEQGRQDQFARLPYEDFERNKLGFLPLLAQMAQAPGTATQGVWGQNQTGGSPGFIDYAAALAPLIAAFAASDERLKDDIRPLDSLGKVERLQPRAWEWKGTGVTDTGFVAQEVRRVAPELVRPITPDGVLGISIPGMMALSVSAIQRLSRRVRELETA